jgi:hypothetical protein
MFLLSLYIWNCNSSNCELCNRKESQITCQLTEKSEGQARPTLLYCSVELTLVQFTSRFAFIVVCNFHRLFYDIYV